MGFRRSLGLRSERYSIRQSIVQLAGWSRPEIPVALKSVSGMFVSEIVTLVLLLFVSMMVCELLSPMTTFPNLALKKGTMKGAPEQS